MKLRTAFVTLIAISNVSFPARSEDLQHLNQLLSTKQCPFCNLGGAGLVMANLQGANLCGANLQGANLSRVNLAGADLSGADLSGASLYGANLSGTNLRGANLTGVDLRDAYLVNADLTGSSLASAYVEGTIGIPKYAGTSEQFRSWGVTEAQKGNYVSAIQRYNQALSIDPNYAPAYLARGLAFYRLGNEAGATKDASTAAKLFQEQDNTEGYELSEQFIKNMELVREEAKKGARPKGSNFESALRAIATLAIQLLLF